MTRKVELSVVVPVYKEECNIEPFLKAVQPILESRTHQYEIIFSLDPSPDHTEAIIEKACRQDARIKLLRFSRRFGQPAATLAGLAYASGAAVVIIDVDLQDPPELIADMYDNWRLGYEVVYAQRKSREGETLPKRIVAHVGYWSINKISDVPIPRNTGDFRLLDRKVVDVINQLPEGHGFLRGLVAYAGYKQLALQFDRKKRQSGSSKYSQITGSIKIGMNGVVAFSTKPLTIASFMGFAVSIISFLLAIWYFIQKVLIGIPLTPGLSTTVILVTFIGGIQLICLGIMGEYIGRIYDEVRRRPKFLVHRSLNFEEGPNERIGAQRFEADSASVALSSASPTRQPKL